MWQPSTGDNGGYPYDNGGSWPSTPDIFLYQVPFYSYSDLRFDVAVPNGTYKITEKFAEAEVHGPGQKIFNLEAQGQVVYQNVDIYASAGGNNLPVDFVLPATVTDGHLQIVIRHVSGPHTNISAIQIAPTP